MTTLPDTNFNNPISTYRTHQENAALALIASIDGPSYRPLDAGMTVSGKENGLETLSTGFVEADIRLNAIEAKKANAPRSVKYGRGSPYFDIPLLCGGGLEILLLPSPDIGALKNSMSTGCPHPDITQNKCGDGRDIPC